MHLTRHAEDRRRQRCLPLAVIKTISDYGTPSFRRGVTHLLLDDDAIALAADGDRRIAADLRRYRHARVIEGDGGAIITTTRARPWAGRGTRRARHP